MKLGALPYHREVAGHLRADEAALWSWFESDQFSQRYADMVKLELLKSTYRLTRADQPDVYAHADTAAERLSLDLPVTVYQSHGGNGGANAALVFLQGEAALTLSGNIGDLLDEEEMLAVIGHELSHHHLYTLDGGLYFTAARLLDWCAAQPGCEDSIHETGRLYRLHTEIYADMGALHVTGNRDAVVSSLVKVSTGLKSVNPLSYLEQTEEILEKRRGSDGLTHPELHIRAKSVDILSGEAPDLNALTMLVRGPLDAKRLDLPGQHSLSGVVRRLVDAVLAPDFMRGEYAANLARRYFEDYEMPAHGPEAGLAGLAAEIAPFAKSCHEVFAYVLLDFATADPEGGDFVLTWTLDVADRLGLFSVYEPLVRKELKRKKDAIAKLRRAAQPNGKISHA